MKRGARLVLTLVWLALLALVGAISLWIAAERVGEHRSSTYGRAYSRFEQSWGGEIGVVPLQFLLERKYTTKVYDRELQKYRDEEKTEQLPLIPRSIEIDARLNYGEQKRGWLTFNAFDARSEDRYAVVNKTEYSGKLLVQVEKPTSANLMYDYKIVLSQPREQVFFPTEKPLTLQSEFNPGDQAGVKVVYATKGVDIFKYNLSTYQRSVVENVQGSIAINTKAFEMYRFGLPHTIEPNQTGATVRFKFNNFATTQDLGVTFLSKRLYLDQIESLMMASPVAPCLFLLVIFILSQVYSVRFSALHYLFLAAIAVFYYLFVAYLIRFFGVVATFGIATALTAAMFFAYCPNVLGRRFALRVAGVYLFLLTVVYSLIFLMPVFRGILGLTLIFLILLSIMIRVSRSDISKWDIVAGGDAPR